MQGIDADIRINVMPGQTLKMPVPPDTLGALAVFPSTGAVKSVKIDSERHRLESARAAGRCGRLSEAVGTDAGPAYLSQFPYAQFQPRRRHARQGQPVFADRLSESRRPRAPS